MANNNISNKWILFIGIVLLLMGVYGATRVVLNLTVFEKYPTDGLFILPGQPQSYAQRESDCFYPRTYYKADGKTTRPATKEEQVQEAQEQKNCLQSVAHTRDTAKTNDISQVVLFLFLGIGVLISRKIFSL